MHSSGRQVIVAQFLDSARAFQNAWRDILAKQLAIAKELEVIYLPIEDQETGSEHGATPQKYLEKATSYRASQLELAQDLQQETDFIQTKLIHPAMEAKEYIGFTKKTIKKRENCKLDYERFKKRVDTLKLKVSSPRDEAALAKYETELEQATWVSQVYEMPRAVD